MRAYLGLALAAVLGFVGTAWAAPLDLKQVDSEAKWAVHVDADAMRNACVVQKAHEQMMQKHPVAAAHLAMVREVWKFDPCNDIHGVTIYGTQVKKDTGVAIVNAKVDQELLLEKVKQAPDYRASTYGNHELSTWTHAKGSKHERSMTGTFYKPDVMVFGGSTAEVMAALDVLDGKKPNLPCKEPSLVGSIPPGAILVAGVGGLADVDLPCKSPLVKQIDLLTVAMGEHDGESFCMGQATVKQADIAQQMKAIVDGARAMVVLTHGDDAELLKLIAALKVDADGNTVTIEWRAPADEVWAYAQKMCKKMSRHGWKHHKLPWHHSAKEK